MYRLVLSPAINSVPPVRPYLIPLVTRLLEQFSSSPICSDVFLEKSLMERIPVTDNSLKRKIHEIKTLSKSSEQPALVLLPDHDSAVPDRNSILHVDGIVVLTSAFGSSAPARKLNSTVESLAQKFPEARISVFECGRIIPNDSDLTGEEKRNWKETVLDDSYRIVSQFLPTKYREIGPRHLAQAIRLNYETCERMLNPDLFYTTL